MRGLEFSRATPSDANTIIHLLQRCERNLVGILLRLEEPVKYSPTDLKKVMELQKSILEMTSSLEDCFIEQHKVVRKPVHKTPVQHSAVQKYLRKYNK